MDAHKHNTYTERLHDGLRPKDQQRARTNVQVYQRPQICVSDIQTVHHVSIYNINVN